MRAPRIDMEWEYSGGYTHVHKQKSEKEGGAAANDGAPAGKEACAKRKRISGGARKHLSKLGLLPKQVIYIYAYKHIHIHIYMYIHASARLSFASCMCRFKHVCGWRGVWVLVTRSEVLDYTAIMRHSICMLPCTHTHGCACWCAFYFSWKNIV